MSQEPEPGRPPGGRRPMATPIGQQRGTVSRLDLPRGARPDPIAAAPPVEGLGTVRSRGRNGHENGTAQEGRQGRRLTGGLVVVALLALAAAIVVGGLTLARPALSGLAVSMARDNPQALKLPFVADLVRAQLGAELTAPAGTDPTPIDFTVPSGATARQVAEALTAQGLIGDPLVFEFLTVTEGQAGTILAGDYTLTALMTPAQILGRLQQPPDPMITLALRPGLRLEQIVAYLETRGLGPTVPQDVERLTRHPTAALRADFPFLAAIPPGGSLEGFLGSSTWQVKPNVSGEAIVRQLLSAWAATVGPAIVARATTGGEAFYRAVILASIVQQEAALDSERPLIAGVYANRLDPTIWSTGLLNADPTIFYANDMVKLAALPLAEWQTYYFWKPVDIALKDVVLPAALVSFQTYTHAGLPAWPICSPNLASLEAALDPDTAPRYLYFVAKDDGSDGHAFARTAAEFAQLLKKYGYVK